MEMPGRQGNGGQQNGQLSCQSSRATATRENKHGNNSYTGKKNLNSRNEPQLTELRRCSVYSYWHACVKKEVLRWQLPAIDSSLANHGPQSRTGGPSHHNSCRASTLDSGRWPCPFKFALNVQRSTLSSYLVRMGLNHWI